MLSKKIQLPALFLAVFALLVIRGGRIDAVGEALNPISTSYVVTMQSIGIDIVYTGDTNGNATMTPQYRIGTDPWITSQPCVTTYANHAACSFFFLTPNTAYSYQVLFTDPDGTSKEVLAGSATTRATAPVETITKTYYVATNGSDSNDGLTAGAPFATVQHAMSLASSGTKIVLAPGLYRENPTIGMSGVTVESQSIATEDGSTPAIFDASLIGYDIVDGVNNWLPDAGRPGGYYTDITGYAPGDQVKAVYRDTEKIYAYSYYPYDETSSYQNYLDGVFCPDGVPSCAASGVTGGYFYDSVAQRLYVALPDSTDPDLFPMHIIKRNSRALTVSDATNVVLRGVQAQYADSGILVKASQYGNATNNWVDRVVTKFCTVGVTVGEAYGYGNRVSGTVLQDSKISDTTAQQDWPWRAVKLNDVESSGVGLAQGAGAIIQRTTIQNVFNGIDATIRYLDDSTYNIGSDIANNTVLNTGDDGIELDGSGINMRVFNNTIISNRDPGGSSQSGISIAPITIGPTWLIRNTAAGIRQSNLKTSYDVAEIAGRVYAYHNTFYSANSDLFAIVRLTQGNNQTGQTLTLRNNLLIATGTEGAGNGHGYIVEDAYTDHTDPPMTLDFDYDNFYSDRTCTGTCPFASWLSVDYPTLSAWSAASGLETHGASLAPSFTNPDTYDFTLRADSAVIDKGILLPGINDDYSEAGPDLGAFEYVPDTTPPAAVTDLRAE